MSKRGRGAREDGKDFGSILRRKKTKKKEVLLSPAEFTTSSEKHRSCSL
jgi:hypothetical protein